MKTDVCESCGKAKPDLRTALVGGVYYRKVCLSCMGQNDDQVSGNAAGFGRRRGYEDNAQDTIQPYDANGQPRSEFLRLYPDAARKVFSSETIDELKRTL